MPKLKSTPVTDRDLADFVASDSDFGFEMEVLTRLRILGFACSHSGTYRDPVSDKMRQFDIRASLDRDESTLALAVECKNIRANNPLLISSVPRTDAEAFHDLFMYRAGPLYPISSIHVATGTNSAYRPGAMVGKKTDQVGREDASGELVSNDEATFDKLSQAVNSCHDLIGAQATKVSPPFRRAIVPVLVIPTGLLWQVDYDADGLLVTPPRQVAKATLFLNHTWTVPTQFEVLSYRLSHLEVVTLDTLAETTEGWFGSNGLFRY